MTVGNRLRSGYLSIRVRKVFVLYWICKTLWCHIFSPFLYFSTLCLQHQEILGDLWRLPISIDTPGHRRNSLGEFHAVFLSFFSPQSSSLGTINVCMYVSHKWFGEIFRFAGWLDVENVKNKKINKKNLKCKYVVFNVFICINVKATSNINSSKLQDMIYVYIETVK